MPVMATAGTQGGTAQSTQNAQQQAPQGPSVAFIRATNEHTEQIAEQSLTLTTAVQTYNVMSIPAYGFLRGVWLQVTTTLAAGAATYTEDAPWNALLNITLQEPNGAIIYQASSGYETYLINKYGGYQGFNDPRARGDFLASTANGNFNFLLWIPLELNERTALGSLPNENSAAAFQLRFQLNQQTGIYATGPATTLPLVRVRAWADEYDQPNLSVNGAPAETVPPAMNTTQFVSPQVYSVVTGQNTIRLVRVGNFIRSLILIARLGTRALGDTNWPDVLTLFVDAQPKAYLQKSIWRSKMYARTGYIFNNTTALDAINSQDTGVFVYDFAHEFDGAIGHEQNDLWLPTLGSTRLEVQGTFGASGSLTVLTNDVAVAGNVFVH